MIESVILDVDGVFTDGSFYYSRKGKILKRFGAHDAQAIKICLPHFKIQLISADLRGFKITSKRAQHMQLECLYVSEISRADWISKNFQKNSTAFIADSFTDIPSLAYVAQSFAPANAHYAFKERVDFVLNSNAGQGAVSEALDILYYSKFSKHLWEHAE
jgi:YrbI family 3-deoxy-D-manno-octulosonate 8-phosphate phosphatase